MGRLLGGFNGIADLRELLARAGKNSAPAVHSPRSNGAEPAPRPAGCEVQSPLESARLEADGPPGRSTPQDCSDAPSRRRAGAPGRRSAISPSPRPDALR